jgi:DNA repair ATPase RecN
VVTKQVEGGRTYTAVRELDGEERCRELAAMLGGVTEAHLAAAAELLREV